MKLHIFGFKESYFDSMICYGANNNTILDRVCAFLLSWSPILQHYKGLYRNAGFTALLLVSPYIFMKLFVKILNRRMNSRCLKAIVPLLFFQVFKMFDHVVSINKLIYGIFMLLMLISIAAGCVNIKYIVKHATLICVVAGAALVLQYIGYYVFGIHIQMVPTSLLLPESGAWVLGAKTGLYGLRGLRNGFYRPSAFFLEPSHHFIYSFPILCLLLMSPNINEWRKRTAFFVSLGMILSTSGMGVMVAIGIWIAYFTLYNTSRGNENRARLMNAFSGKNILILLLIIITIIIAYNQISVFRNMFDRIFGPGSSGGSTAIDGRTKLARGLVNGLSGKRLIIGVTEDVNELNFNLSGFFSTLYKYGLVGIILSYLFYIPGLFRLNGAGFWVSLIIVVVSFFTAHTHGTFYMMYYVFILINAYSMKDENYKEIEAPISFANSRIM